ncbi:MAG: Dabb family protein [Verrucomicrobia bacterium]|nr:MAG: Dabb family protein [Verrucomicrobiota bacterium]
MITHVVVFWTDKPSGEAREKIAAGARELLTEVPGAMEFRSGVSVPSPRGVVDDSFAAAISMTFRDQAAADAYLAHPLHVRFVEECVKPYVRRFVVYDFGAP